MYHVSTVRIPIYRVSSETCVADQAVFESPRRNDPTDSPARSCQGIDDVNSTNLAKAGASSETAGEIPLIELRIRIQRCRWKLSYMLP